MNCKLIPQLFTTDRTAPRKLHLFLLTVLGLKHTRALERRKTVPSTLLLTVDEYKAKPQGKLTILPHELVRFIGLLVAQSLEPRRESLSRHWITKVEGTLS
ncbi:Hypothetical protein PHPALM_36252 [Phytophthora palmivora]|uniref:Uncharacterized protein n=1 Tax=Phytophthora palmivora TaxID=4796 RepID=A0A2P4X0E5_9STRA|nr:Hypothetical protein PHPALM_36252 [Phytophthora palmivora]